MNKIDDTLTRLIKERAQTNKIRNEKGELISKLQKEIQRTIRDYYEQLYANKIDKLEEVDKFLETYSFPRLNQEEM